jgi:hypothetical protein
MLLLLIDALLLLFITTGLGMMSARGLEKLFGVAAQSDFLGIFLTGIITSSIYFNILSFFIPVNYLALIPLAAASVFFFATRKNARLALRDFMRRQLAVMRLHLLPASCIAVLLVCYCFVPPSNPDSAGYHYNAIAWYENYKVIPGLGNIHGRLGFNPVSFIIQSAYAFTGPAGQGLYPLNSVLTILFFVWAFNKMARSVNSASALVYMGLIIVLYRLLLANMTSPSSEPLTVICVSYLLLHFYEAICLKEITASSLIVPFVILLFAPVAKLSAYPLLLLAPFAWYYLPRIYRRRFLQAICVLWALVYLPWLGRNYILTGYLVYPLRFTDFFSPDWKLPNDIVLLDYTFIRDGPRMVSRDPAAIDYYRSLSFIHWFYYWVNGQVATKNYAELAVLFIGLSSPLAWIGAFFQKNKPGCKLLVFWICTYTMVWIWLVTSGDYRAGSVMLSMSFALPFLYWMRYPGQTINKAAAAILPVLLVASTIYYVYGGVMLFKIWSKKTGVPIPVAWQKSLLLPMQHAAYYVYKKEGFAYRQLGNDVRLYLPDSLHACVLMGCQPCMTWAYGDIEMRGAIVEDGFRNKYVEVRKHFPILGK